MKRIITFLLIFTAVLVSNLHAQQDFTEAVDSIFQETQPPYKASVGGSVSPIFPVIAVLGVSYKSFITKYIAFQTDIYIKTILTGDIIEKAIFYTSYVTNTNIVYQKKLKERKNSDLFWLLGGGASLGFTVTGNAKFGANAIMGLEYLFYKKNLAIQLDLRPGYGILFSSYSRLNRGWMPSLKNPWSHFDWYWGVSFRYVFKEKVSSLY